MPHWLSVRLNIIRACFVVLFVCFNILLNNSKDHVPELPEQASLQWLCRIIRHHGTCRTILNPDLLIFDPVGDEEISDVNVFEPFST